MMKKFLQLLVFFAVIVFFTVLAFHSHGGSVLFTVPPYRVEVSFLFFILCASFIFFGGYFLIRLVDFFFRIPDRLRTIHQRKKHNSALRLFSEGFVYFLEGRYARAANAAEQSFEANLVPIVSGLMAAQSYHALGKVSERDYWLDVVKNLQGGERAQRLTAAELYLNDNNPTRALELLSPYVLDSSTRYLAVTRLLFLTYLSLENWSEAMRCFRILEKRQSIHPASFFSLKQELYQGLVSNTESVEDLKKFFSCLSESDQKLHIVRVVKRFLELLDYGLARRYIEDYHRKDWSSELALLYSDSCEDNTITHQIECAEFWLLNHQDDAYLLVTLAKLCQKKSLWGKAREYLEQACSYGDDMVLPIYEKASLLDRLGEHEQANVLYRRCAKKTLSRP
ncbi:MULTISPECIES: heme biosynthesis HemY N-terminal domain-containing protein [Candidatus Ichthyocystis]|uniref:Putative porphyrin biogenesis protein, HemY n=1 Tax=Candidatus Ichthyocystis hellenicum TaxID=1561003 RepID=A0A0S4M472_9BURK|nr:MULTISPECIES: heme biosynthesis HemY N-terminal domain-containing protein [Ichthyocystis]CUT17807.1 putative porphyrin biogenesis protein, HemY [Candidatus Ichthyocystis hellenicum]